MGLRHLSQPSVPSLVAVKAGLGMSVLIIVNCVCHSPFGVAGTCIMYESRLLFPSLSCLKPASIEEITAVLSHESTEAITFQYSVRKQLHDRTIRSGLACYRPSLAPGQRTSIKVPLDRGYRAD